VWWAWLRIWHKIWARVLSKRGAGLKFGGFMNEILKFAFWIRVCWAGKNSILKFGRFGRA